MKFVYENALIICKDVLNAAIEEIYRCPKKKSDQKLSATQLVLIKELVDVLNTFEAALSQFEGESKVTINNGSLRIIGRTFDF